MRFLRLYIFAFVAGLVMGLAVPGHADFARRPAGEVTAGSTPSGGARAGHGPEGDSASGDIVSVPASDGRAAISQAQAEKMAEMMVDRRDRALVEGDREQLESLTVESSPARAYDMAIFEQIEGRITALETDVESVSVRGPLSIEVWTVQRNLVLDDGVELGQAQRRCTRWEMEPDPWRITDTGECESH
ncbi:MAG: hypothetical protein Q3979_06710 [Actinomycetaceae bacterium]|nr:hypothetical protein [Actinomycetaceae bacterium]